MTKTNVCLAAVAMLSLLSGCGASAQTARVDTTPLHAQAATHRAQANADMMPGEYEVSWSGPTERVAPRESSVGVEYRPECASKKGRLLVGKIETTSFK
jgi:hypothetical protein